MPWKTVQHNHNHNNNNNINSIGNSTNFTLPSYLRLGGGGGGGDQRCHDYRSGETGAAGTSSNYRDSIASTMKYRSSISDLGGSSSALVQFTNTRIKSITNRRGAVKYQKYVFLLLFSSIEIIFTCPFIHISIFTEHMTSMDTNLWRNSFDNQHSAPSAKNSYGDSGNRDINATVSFWRFFSWTKKKNHSSYLHIFICTNDNSLSIWSRLRTQFTS